MAPIVCLSPPPSFNSGKSRSIHCLLIVITRQGLVKGRQLKSTNQNALWHDQGKFLQPFFNYHTLIYNKIFWGWVYWYLASLYQVSNLTWLWYQYKLNTFLWVIQGAKPTYNSGNASNTGLHWLDSSQAHHWAIPALSPQILALSIVILMEW